MAACSTAWTAAYLHFRWSTASRCCSSSPEFTRNRDSAPNLSYASLTGEGGIRPCAGGPSKERTNMANRRDSHFEERERWRDNPSPSQDWGPRHERESGRYGQWEQNEGYGERERSSSRNQGWEEPQRFRNEEDWGRRG